jgi:serine/threonine protein kinase/WD40 repeat protein
MATGACVGEGDLRLLLLGELAAPEAQAVTRHLEDCPRCEEAARRLDAQSDPFLSTLRQAANLPAAAKLAPQTRAADGTTISPYQLIEQIGEGGMGTVWMARQTEPVKRLVAIKLIQAGMASRQILARFEAERQALALMDHPNIARVLDAGTSPAGRPYFVMDLVRGMPITRYCDQHRLTLRQRLELFIPVCQAVQHAHQKGIIHRDLKPSNVLVAPCDGKPLPRVIDFGVAKAAGQLLTDKTLVTNFGAIIGTPEYMSPEQAEFNQPDIDTRSDIYALGVLFYELLAGSPPFTRHELTRTGVLEMLRVIREEEPSKPSTKLSTTVGLPTLAANRGTEPARLTRLLRGELDWIVMKALEKDRGRRYQTADALARDLERYLADEPVQAGRPSTVYRFRKFCRRNKVWLSAAALVVATLLAAVPMVTWKWWDAERARKQAEEAGTRAVAAERESRLREAEALVGQARGARLSRRPGQRFDALAALQKAVRIGRQLEQSPEWFDPLRNEAIAALSLLDLQIRQEFGHIPDGMAAVELSDDFELYTQLTEKGDCTVRRMSDDALFTRLPGFGAFRRGKFGVVGFGPGRTLAVRDNSHRFQFWDISRSRPVRRFEEVDVHSWEFHPRGSLIGLTHLDAAVSIYDVASGTRLYRLPSLAAVHAVLRFHPTEPLLALFCYTTRTVPVRDWRTGAVVATATPPWSDGNGFGCWAPDGRTLLVPEGDGNKIQEYLFDPSSRRLTPSRSFEVPYQGLPAITFNAAGDRVITHGWTGTLHVLDVRSDRLLFTTPVLPKWDNDGPMRFDATGKRLASARVGEHRDRVGVWSFAPGREYRYLARVSSTERSWEPAVHPGGRLGAVGRRDGVVLLDLETGRELARVSLPGEQPFVQFDGIGSLLTNGPTGFFRWPVRPDPSRPARLLIGPPRYLPFHGGRYPVAASRDGRVVAQAMFTGYGMSRWAGGWILHPNSPKPRCVDPGVGMERASVSPDGRWVAFLENAGTVRVYEAATGRRVWQSPPTPHDFVAFSADGRWLITSGDNARTYQVGTWQPGPQLGLGIPWHATTELAVLGLLNGTYRLVELATGRELARLEAPEQNTGPAVFSPDGSQLILEAKDGLRVWDLRAVRAGLRELDLDWDSPPFPPSNDAVKAAALEVVVDQEGLSDFTLAQRQADELRTRGDLVGALAVIRKAQALAPDDNGLRNYLAWLLALCPDPKLRDLPRAVALARAAREEQPEEWLFLRTLGLALHLAGDDAAAVPALRRALELSPEGNSFDYFPLAAANQKLGHAEEARQWYRKGLAWMAEHRHPHQAELAILRADAQSALGPEKRPPEAPDKTAPVAR